MSSLFSYRNKYGDEVVDAADDGEGSDEEGEYERAKYHSRLTGLIGGAESPPIIVSVANWVFVLLVLAGGLFLTGSYLYGYEELLEKLKKIEQKFTTTPAPTTTAAPNDWREVDIDGLSPEEQEKVKAYALAQATFDVVTSGIILIGSLFLLSFATGDGAYSGWARTISSDSRYGMLVFAMVAVSAALYGLFYTFRISRNRRNPENNQFWSGDDYEAYTPYKMLGTVAVGAVVSAGLMARMQQKWPGAIRTWGWDGVVPGENRSYVFGLPQAFAIGVGVYITYAFYGSYISSTIKGSDSLSPVLVYLYPLFTTAVITLVAYLYSNKNKDAAAMAAAICAGLIVFRSAGQTVSSGLLKTDFSFWTDLLVLVLVIAGVTFGFFVVSGQTNLLKTFGGAALGQGARAGGGIRSAVARSVNTVSLSIAAFLGGFLFFSLQLFWSTSMILGDVGLASLATVLIVIVGQSVFGQNELVKTTIYSGFAVTGVMWYMLRQRDAFQFLSSQTSS